MQSAEFEIGPVGQQKGFGHDPHYPEDEIQFLSVQPVIHHSGRPLMDGCDQSVPNWDRSAVLPPPGKIKPEMEKGQKKHIPCCQQGPTTFLFVTCQVLSESARPILELDQLVWEPWESPCLLLVKNSSVVIKQEYL